MFYSYKIANFAKKGKSSLKDIFTTSSKGIFVVAFIIISSFYLSSCKRVNIEDHDVGESVDGFNRVSLPVYVNIDDLEFDDTANIAGIENIEAKLFYFDNLSEPFLNLNLDLDWYFDKIIDFENDYYELVLVKNRPKEHDAFMQILVSFEKSTNDAISALLLCVDNYYEELGKLETELWESVIDKDKSVKISKKYNSISSNKKRDLIDLMHTDNQTKQVSEVEETYKLGENGVFEFVKREIYADISNKAKVKSYKSVVAFINQEVENTISSENLYDDWLFVNANIQNELLNHKVSYQQVLDNFENVIIRNFQNEEVDTINFTPILENFDSGFLLIKSNSEPLILPFGEYEDLINKMSDYFSFKIFTEDLE